MRINIMSDVYVDEAIFEEYSEEREKQERQLAVEKAETYASSVNIDIYNGSEIYNISGIKSNAESLQEYVQCLIQMESNIYSLTKRLGELYFRHLELTREVDKTKYEILEDFMREIKEQIAKVKEKIWEKERILKRVSKENPFKPSIVYPEKPQKPVKSFFLPTKPQLEKTNLFNRRRVERENQRKTERFQQEMMLYRQKNSEYEAACETYRIACVEYERQMNDCRMEEARQIEEKRQSVEKEIQSVLREIELVKKEYDELLLYQKTHASELFAMPIPIEAAVEMLEKEIAEAERLLKETYAARNQLYACNVIFPKYRNLVALSTFYEYLMTGRCVSLEGATGAYNLYESECRADMIISQLSTVIESLEKIKQNQYMIYSELRSINSRLSSLNSTMNAALNSIRNIDAKMGKVVETSEMIAHNTSVGAHYSKMNAQLTNALGYMVAFK